MPTRHKTKSSGPTLSANTPGWILKASSVVENGSESRSKLDEIARKALRDAKNGKLKDFPGDLKGNA